jgi:hypothetical protein
MTPTTIAAVMRRQAESAGLASRRLPGGLIVRYSQSAGARSLVLMRRHPGPAANERERWRKAFGVPAEVFEYKGLQEEYVFVQWDF